MRNCQYWKPERSQSGSLCHKMCWLNKRLNKNFRCLLFFILSFNYTRLSYIILLSIPFMITLQAFINHNFSYKRFRARLSTWKIMYIKEQTCNLLIITWYGRRNRTKLQRKPLAAKNGLSIQSCVLLLSCRLYFSLHDN